jgi:uncharacterized membrane protein
MVVSPKVSALKSIVWRLMGVFILAAVTYFYTRQWIVTTKITLVHHSFFLVVFFLYERLWTHIALKGRIRNITKSLIYEIILGMGFGGLIVYLFTGSFPMITKITPTYTAIKLVMYYFYDRMWPEVK